jgi:hypothetical protein
MLKTKCMLYKPKEDSPRHGRPVSRNKLGSLLRSRKERSRGSQVEIMDARAFAEAAGEAKLVLVEDENHRMIIAPKDLLA